MIGQGAIVVGQVSRKYRSLDDIPWNAAPPPALRFMQRLFTLLMAADHRRGPSLLTRCLSSIPDGILMGPLCLGQASIPRQRQCLAMIAHSTMLMSDGDHECKGTTKALLTSRQSLLLFGITFF